MNKQVRKFIEFNGKTLLLLTVEGKYWVALKPICEALGVDYNRVFQNTKKDPIFSEVLTLQLMIAADGQFRNMSSLPEKLIYGWIMQLRSKSPELLQYKKLCCKVLTTISLASSLGARSY